MNRNRARYLVLKHLALDPKYFWLRTFSWGGLCGAIVTRRPKHSWEAPERILVGRARSWEKLVRQACSGFTRVQA